MFRPLSLYMGLKYTRAKKKSHFVSFISFSSMIGIALGVAVLITVLSVMNGFDSEIHHRFFGMAPEITVSSSDGSPIQNWEKLAKKLASFNGVIAYAPYVGAQGLVSFDGQVQPLILSGILPQYEKNITQLSQKLLAGNLDNMSHFGIVLGRGLADSLGVMMGDKITIMTPEATATPAGMIPRFKRFRVAGVFSAGPGFGFESKLAFIDLPDAQKLMHYGLAVSGIKLKIKNVYDAPSLAKEMNQAFDGKYIASDWTLQFGAFFEAVKMEKTMMFLILILIIAVAAFNLVSSLVMLVNDKQADIAILRTIGATPSFILKVFMLQGLFIGMMGTLLGVTGGLFLAYNATEIVNHLQQWFNIQLMSSSVYFVDFVPSKIDYTDVLKVVSVSLGMSFLATLYPAYRASKTVIAEALHHE